MRNGFVVAEVMHAIAEKKVRSFVGKVMRKCVMIQSIQFTKETLKIFDSKSYHLVGGRKQKSSESFAL